jgi:hypothetical protein
MGNNTSSLFHSKIIIFQSLDHTRIDEILTVSLGWHSSRKEEINIIGGANQNAFSTFYDRLREIKEYHRKFPNQEMERPEAEQFLNNFDITAEPPVQFTTEEGNSSSLSVSQSHPTLTNSLSSPLSLSVCASHFFHSILSNSLIPTISYNSDLTHVHSY